MNANPTLLQMKWARIVNIFAVQNNLPTAEALDLFYHSSLYELMKDGVADIHCESDGYLAELLAEEWRETNLKCQT